MDSTGTSRPARLAGRVLLAALLLSSVAGFAVPETPDELLRRADQIRTTDNAQFQSLLKQLDAQAARLSPLQRDWLAYYKGWQSGLQGDFPSAVAALTAVLGRTQDPTLRARARISLLNDQFNAAQYEAAYANLSVLLDSLPQVKDRNAHFLSLTVAADLYNQAGQYDLAEGFTDQALAYDRSDTSICYALLNKTITLYKTGQLHDDDPQVRGGLEACQRIGDPVYANLFRLTIAQAQLEHGDVARALRSLETHDAEVQSTHSSALISLFRATLAKCYLRSGNLAKAAEYADSAVDFANKQVNSKASADAWQVLYQVAEKQGDDKHAVVYLEKFAAADKGYLNDVSAHALAYQMVHQQVLDKKAQLAALNQQYQVLKLRQAINRKNMLAAELGFALLLVVLGSIALYAYRTKRSQVKFMKLARRDGLTDIYNRQYFVEASEQELAYCQKTARDVSVIVIDLDHFKDINDTHGHAAGDFALKRAVAMCQQHLRSIDVFGRLGGEEFGILLPDCVPERAADLAEAMRLSIERMAASEEGPEFPVRASFGVAAARWSGYDLRPLLAHADSALYQAKREGRNRVVVYAGAAANTAPAPEPPERRRSMPYTAREDVRR